MNNAVIVGNGIIGRATGTMFGIKDAYDIEPIRSNVSLEEVAKHRLIFICLPTPTINGEAEISGVIQVIEDIEDLVEGNTHPTYVIRSTVTPGTADKIMKELKIDSVVSNPEFLSEDTWANDIRNPDLIVVGGKSQERITEVINVYKGRYKGVNIFRTTNITAEMIKYAINCFFSTKVVYANAIYDICQKVGANYETLKNAMYSNSNIARNHLVINYKGKRGVNGRCLPKDLESFANWSEHPFLGSVLKASYLIPQEENA